MEPAFAVELNNELRLAEQAEQAEMNVSSGACPRRLPPHAGQLLHNLEVIAELDAIFARAKFSRAIGGTEPIINDRASSASSKAATPTQR